MRCKKAAFSKFAFALILCDFVRPPVAWVSPCPSWICYWLVVGCGPNMQCRQHISEMAGRLASAGDGNKPDGVGWTLFTCLFWAWASCPILYSAILLYILKVPRPNLWSEFGSWWEICKEWHIMESAVPGCPESYDHDTRVQHHGQPNGRQGLWRDSCVIWGAVQLTALIRDE